MGVETTIQVHRLWNSLYPRPLAPGNETHPLCIVNASILYLVLKLQDLNAITSGRLQPSCIWSWSEPEPRMLRARRSRLTQQCRHCPLLAPVCELGLRWLKKKLYPQIKAQKKTAWARPDNAVYTMAVRLALSNASVESNGRKTPSHPGRWQKSYALPLNAEPKPPRKKTREHSDGLRKH